MFCITVSFYINLEILNSTCFLCPHVTKMDDQEIWVADILSASRSDVVNLIEVHETVKQVSCTLICSLNHNILQCKEL